MEQNKSYKYKFSVVIPIYNVEHYLSETVDSVIEQDIGFEENIQIILVNDGSPDDSERVCLEYVKKYPNNIKYVKQENAGVSAARNNGMNYVEGKYVNFLDSDDKWSEDAFSEVYNFFEEHYEEIDLVSCKQEFFEAQEGLHPLSKFKYSKGDRVIDVFSDFASLQLHITASFIKASAIRISQFVEGMKFGEDALYVNEIILEKHKYGVVEKPTHFYRKRANNSSAVQNKTQDFDWYMITPQNFYGRLFEKSKEQYGEVIPYIQFLFAYDFRYRLNEDIEAVLDAEQVKEYKEYMRSLVCQCEDYILFLPKGIYVEKKLFLLILKYGYDVRERLIYLDQKLYYDNMPICDFGNSAMCSMDIVEIEDGVLHMAGQIWSPFYKQLDLWLEDRYGKRYPLVGKYSSHREATIWGESIIKDYVYELELPLEGINNYRVRGLFQGRYPITPKLVAGKFAKIHDNLKNIYYVKDGYCITKDRKQFFVEPITQEQELAREKKLRLELKKQLKDSDVGPKTKKEIREGMLYRKWYFRIRGKKKKQLWLVTDRINLAGDNGEAFFRYMTKQNFTDIDVYFVISSTSKDYGRMKEIGKVLSYKSFRHKLATLLADKIVSSQGEDNIVNPFAIVKKYVGSLFKYKYVFLQHGIIKDDISKWLNKYNKNIHMFVTSAYPEYRSVLDCSYNYGESVVKLTGLPRYDTLIQEKPSEKSIIFLPTWRTSLAIEMDQVTGVRPYNTEFKKSNYYQFYQRLINDERILEVMRERGYSGKFCVHTNNLPNAIDFAGNDVIEVVASAIEYQKEFRENALLITDYSSVAYDFAYLKKPVIYTQPDREEFFASQMYEEGYWDYDAMGFGPVCKDYDSTVEAIVKQIQQDCVLDEMYKKRIQNFFFAFDQDNCKRVYDEIRKL